MLKKRLLKKQTLKSKSRNYLKIFSYKFKNKKINQSVDSQNLQSQSVSNEVNYKCLQPIDDSIMQKIKNNWSIGVVTWI